MCAHTLVAAVAVAGRSQDLQQAYSAPNVNQANFAPVPASWLAADKMPGWPCRSSGGGDAGMWGCGGGDYCFIMY